MNKESFNRFSLFINYKNFKFNLPLGGCSSLPALAGGAKKDKILIKISPYLPKAGNQRQPKAVQTTAVLPPHSNQTQGTQGTI